MFTERLHLAVTDDHKRFRVLRPSEFLGARGDRWVVPEGFETDLGTVWWFLRWLVPSWGPAWTEAYVIHDYLCHLNRIGMISRADADGVMRMAIKESAEELGLRWTKRLRWVAWAGVRFGGFIGVGK